MPGRPAVHAQVASPCAAEPRAELAPHRPWPARPIDSGRDRRVAAAAPPHPRHPPGQRRHARRGYAPREPGGPRRGRAGSTRSCCGGWRGAASSGRGSTRRGWPSTPGPAARSWSPPGTASGKSLGYLLPVLSRLLADAVGARDLPRPDQGAGPRPAQHVRGLALAGVRAAAYDGDTPREEREWVRATPPTCSATPTCSPAACCRSTRGGRAFLRGLEFVVIDECHHYRGVFGSHVAQVMRRLRRVCARYGADPDLRARLGDRRRPGQHRLPPHRPAASRSSTTTRRRAAR